ncbi:Ribosomal protein L11 methyltransferase [Linum grandiflorum]
MSGGSHFFKHLSGSLNRSLIHRHSRLLQLPSITTIGLQSPVPLWKPLSSFSPNISTTTTSTGSPSFSSVSATSSSASTTNLTSSASAYRSYVSVQIRCPRHAYESFSDALLEFGASSTTVNDDENDQGDSEVFDGINEVVVDSIFLECEDVKGCILKAANAAGLNKTPSYDVKMGEQDDWVQKSLEFFDPVEVTEGLWIVPEWKSPPDIHATNIILNPGVAFGTGEHSTTKLCLLLLKRLIKGGECFLDYGTGSGVLGIAALKFGAATSVGIDVDEQAITSARNNAALNNIGPETMKLHLVSGKMDSRTDKVVRGQSSNVTGVFPETETCDVVIANILLNPLLELADNIVSFAKPGAIVAVSGVLSEQVPQITDRYSQLLEDLQVTEMDGWACVTGRKEATSQRS